MNLGQTGRDLIRIPPATLSAIHAILLRERGGLEAAQILRDIGLATGGTFYELFQASLARDGNGQAQPDWLDSQTFWRSLGDFFEELGFGRLEHEPLADGVFALYSSDWAEARGTVGGSGCHFTAGLLAEILHRLAGQDLAVLEVEDDQVATGGCRFIVGSPDTLAAVFAHIRNGSAYRDAIQTVSTVR